MINKLNVQDIIYNQIPGLLEKGIKFELKELEDIKNLTKDELKLIKYSLKRVKLSFIKPSQFGLHYENPSSILEAKQFQKVLEGDLLAKDIIKRKHSLSEQRIRRKSSIKDVRIQDFYPIIVDKNTNKIIDGNHRHYALSKIKSPYAVVLYVNVKEK
jgi:hypothetical protein